MVQGTVKKLYHSPKGMGESAVGVRMVMLISCLIYVFILKATKKANKYYKMWCKSGHDVSSYTPEWGEGGPKRENIVRWEGGISKGTK